jgi:acyl-coenzyme A thioesterase PaaI-like protein
MHPNGHSVDMGSVLRQLASGVDAKLLLGQVLTSAAEHDGVLPPHSARCLGCGPDNPHGPGLVVRLKESAVASELTLDARHEGAPGVAHGGAVALAFDDLFGFLLYLVGDLGVTRNLTVDYLAPARLGIAHQLRAVVGKRDGRRVEVSGSMTTLDGRQIATASATFVIVDPAHFITAAQP